MLKQGEQATVCPVTPRHPCCCAGVVVAGTLAPRAPVLLSFCFWLWLCCCRSAATVRVWCGVNHCCLGRLQDAHESCIMMVETRDGKLQAGCCVCAGGHLAVHTVALLFLVFQVAGASCP